jgi:3-hydroxyisobutyrate dehydrogenase-like beta-hydroxyacid dehydrogenase
MLRCAFLGCGMMGSSLAMALLPHATRYTLRIYDPAPSVAAFLAED